MADPGWYDDPTAPGGLRWWDGSSWTAHTAPSTAAPRPPQPTVPVPPAPMPKLRSDGTVRGPSFRLAMAFLLPGLLLVVVASVVVIPDFLASINGPRIEIPGRRSLDLETGTWVLFERTGSTRGTGGFTFETNRGVSIRPEQVRVTGPASVETRSHLGGTTETIERGAETFTGAVRFEITVEGRYEIEILGGADGEVLVARPLGDFLHLWPFWVAGGLGGIAATIGLVLWLVGAMNRRTARRAGAVS